MEGINERFKQLIKALGMNSNSFAKSLGKTQSSVAAIIEGRSKPGFEFLELIATTYPQISRDWLLMGEGPMMREAVKASDPDVNIKHYVDRLETKFLGLLEAKDRQMEWMQRTIDHLRAGKLNGVSRRPNKKRLNESVNVPNLFNKAAVVVN